VYRNFDNEMKPTAGPSKLETGSNSFGEQVSRIEFQGFDSLEDTQAFCEKRTMATVLLPAGMAGHTKFQYREPFGHSIFTFGKFRSLVYARPFNVAEALQTWLKCTLRRPAKPL
jgi:hypothetical protein